MFFLELPVPLFYSDIIDSNRAVFPQDKEYFNMGIPELKKILYVEDALEIQEIAKLALEEIGGFSVKVVGSGVDALQLIPEFLPDMILLDVMMPEMEGMTVFGELRKLPEASDIPVILFTAKIQHSEAEQYKALGIADVISKPFDPVTLSDTVRTIWSKYHE